MRPIRQSQFLPAAPPLYPESAIVIECHSQSLESRIHAKDVNGPRGTPAFPAMANGQIKGAGNAGNDRVNHYQTVIKGWKLSLF